MHMSPRLTNWEDLTSDGYFSSLLKAKFTFFSHFIPVTGLLCFLHFLSKIYLPSIRSFWFLLYVASRSCLLLKTLLCMHGALVWKVKRPTKHGGKEQLIEIEKKNIIRKDIFLAEIKYMHHNKLYEHVGMCSLYSLLQVVLDHREEEAKGNLVGSYPIGCWCPV